MRAGRLRHRVQFQNLVDGGRNEFGDPAQDWQDEFQEFAGVEPLRGQERFLADQQQSETTTRIVVRHNTNTDRVSAEGWRVVFRSRNYYVTGVVNQGTRDRTVELMCSEGLRE